MSKPILRQTFHPLATMDVAGGGTLRAEVSFPADRVVVRVKLLPMGETLGKWWLPWSTVRSWPPGRVLDMAKSLLERLAAAAGARSAHVGVVDQGTRKKYPGLAELMTDEKGPDGAERELSALTMKWQDGTWKAGIHEPNMEMTLWVSAPSLEGLLLVLEERVGSEDADWRPWGGAQKKKGFKPRK